MGTSNRALICFQSVLYLNFLPLNPPKVCFFSRFGDFDAKILYLCSVYLTHINLTAVTL